MGRGGGGNLSSLTEEERRALRGSKFAPLPSHQPSSSTQQKHQYQQQKPRLAHPGGPLTTNKAAALAKFLERKLQQPGGLDSIKPELLDLAVKNAKETVNASNSGAAGRTVRHVASFDDNSEYYGEEKRKDANIADKPKLKKKGKSGDGTVKTKSKKKKRRKMVETSDRL